MAPWSVVLLKKVTVTQLAKKLSACYEIRKFTACSQDAAIGTYPELEESSQNIDATSCQVLLPKSSLILSPCSTVNQPVNGLSWYLYTEVSVRPCLRAAAECSYD